MRLHALFALRGTDAGDAPAASATDADEPAAAEESPAPVPAERMIDLTAAPLGVVQGAAPDGPAYAAGLRSGMQILRFGSATAEGLVADGTGLDVLSAIVGASAGGEIEVVARTPGTGFSVHRIRIPRPARLGLHVVPVPSDKPMH